MMTREEAIKQLEDLRLHCRTMIQDEYEDDIWVQDVEALDTALTALRPVSREQVEKVWRGCPECKPRCGLCVNMGGWDRYGKPYVCEQCVDYSNFESDQRFCEVCGAPMTDEAVEMVMRRLEALKDGSTTD